MLKLALFLLMCLFAAPIAAESVYPAFETPEEAAVHAIIDAEKLNNRVEYSGWIYRIFAGDQVLYIYSPPYTVGVLDHAISTPPTMVPYGQYHTHPCFPVTHFVHFFSEEDITAYYHFFVVGFVGDTCAGEVLEFNPLIDPPFNVGKLSWLEHITLGRVVGTFKPIAPMTESPAELKKESQDDDN